MRNRIFHIASLILFTTVLLISVAGTVHVMALSPPRETGRIAGITLDLPDAFVVITRHHLDCEHDTSERLNETCSVRLDDELLTVNAVHGAMNQFNLDECRVAYRGEDRFCYGRVETISTPPYAIISSLDVPDDVLSDLERRHFLTSRRGESAWWQFTTNAAVILAASSAPLALSQSRGKITRRLILTAVTVAGVFVVGLVLLRIALFTTGFVD